MGNKMLCQKCVLDESVPRVNINRETGICNLCENNKVFSEKEISDNVRELFNVIGKNKSSSKYDILVSLSGGKDSSYQLYMLHKFFPNARFLAVLCDNGFITDTAKENAKKIADYVGADLQIINLPKEPINEVFRQVAQEPSFPRIATLRASPICIACSHLFKQINLRIALENNIRVISYGWTRGQSKLLKIKLSKPLMLKNSKYVETFIKDINPNSPLRKLLPTVKQINKSKNLPIQIHPLNAIKYNEDMIIKTLKEKVGWNYKKLGSYNTSNCKLNSLATYLHQKKYGFHPYSMEIAGIVRADGMSREKGKKKIKELKLNNEIKECAQKINLDEGLLK